MSPRTPRTRTVRSYAATAATGTLLLGLVGASTVDAGVEGSASRAVTTVSAYAGKPLPARIGASPPVRQMITVTSGGWSTTTATLKAWHRGKSGRWSLVHGPLPVRIGYNGWVHGGKRVQSTGTTPAGRYRLPYTFGRLSDPGAHLRYRHFDRNDWWPYEPRDSATYNVWQWHKAPSTHWRADKSERLWDYYAQYAYGIVVGFNLPGGIHYSHRKRQWVADERADTGRGGGIFLHVNGTGATAGCVSMARAQVRWLIRWLRPAEHAQVVMGPYSYVLTL